MFKQVYTDKYEIVGNSPAVIVENNNTGNAVIYLNKNIFPHLTLFQQKFVVQHELGHYILDTDNEIEADAYAFDTLAGTEFQSLKQSINVIYELLPVMNTGRLPRLKAMVENALQWDYLNGNQQAQQELFYIQSLRPDEFLKYFENNYLGEKKRFFWKELAGILTGGVTTTIDAVSGAISGSQNLKAQQQSYEYYEKIYEDENARLQNQLNASLAGQQQQTSMMMVVIMAVAAILIMRD